MRVKHNTAEAAILKVAPQSKLIYIPSMIAVFAIILADVKNSEITGKT
jgi:hypothetical protein